MALLHNLILLVGLVAHGICDTGTVPPPASPTTSSSLTTAALASASITSLNGTTTAGSSKTSVVDPLRGETTVTDSPGITVDGPWVIQFSPLSDNVTAPWGVKVENATGPGKSQLFPLILGDETRPAIVEESTYLVKDAYVAGNTSIDEELLLKTTEVQFHLGYTGHGSYTINSSSWPNWVFLEPWPFGINLGHDGYFNGSLVFSGTQASYDANRVVNGTWGYLPLPDDDEIRGPNFCDQGSTFIANISIQEYDSTSSFNTTNAYFGGAKPTGAPMQYAANLDFNAAGIFFPKSASHLCQKSNFTITLDVISIDTNSSTYMNKLVIPISTRLTQSTGRCAEVEDSRVTLGQTFFQAAYLMIPDETGRVFLAAANDQDLPIAPHPFDPTVARVIPKSSNNASPNKTAEIIGTVFAVVFCLAMVGLLVFLMLRHRRRAAEENRPKNSVSPIDSSLD